MGFLSRHGIIASQTKAKVAPVYVGNAFSTGKTIALPTHQAGDLLVCAATGYFNGSVISVTPPGWTMLLNNIATDIGVLLYKVAASSSETCAFTASSTWATGNIAFCIRGAKAATPINVSAIDASFVTTTTPTAPTVTTTAGSVAVLNIVMDYDALNNRVSSIVNANLTALTEISDGGNSDGGCRASFGVKGAAGVVGTTVFNSVSMGTPFRATLAINPL